MMNALPLMAMAAGQFRDRLTATQGSTVLPVPASPRPIGTPPADLRWENLMLSAGLFRRAHVETFHIHNNLSVLHVCVFPHLDSSAPIFGFDMVAGPSRVTGIFLDLSPVVLPAPFPLLHDVVDPRALADFATKRPPPDWGHIFSSDFLAVRPIDLVEVLRAIELAHQALDAVLTMPRSRHPHDYSGSGQARYIAAQRRNDHTLRMLASFVGLEPAR